MKYLSIILLSVFLGTGLYAHCGSCGVGASKKEHSKEYVKPCDSCEVEKYNQVSIDLTSKQEKKLKELRMNKKRDIEKIKAKYLKSVKKVIKDSKKRDQYLNSLK